MDRLFGDITAMAAPGSRIVFDFMDLAVMDGRKRVPGYRTMARSVANKVWMQSDAAKTAISTQASHKPGQNDTCCQEYEQRCSATACHTQTARSVND